MCISEYHCWRQSSICIAKAKSFGSQLHMTVFLVLRIKAHVYGLVQTIVYKTDWVTGAVFQTTEMYPSMHTRQTLSLTILVTNSNLTSFWRSSLYIKAAKIWGHSVKTSSLPLCDLCTRMTPLRFRTFLIFPNYWIPEFLNLLKSNPNRRPPHYNSRIYARYRLFTRGSKFALANFDRGHKTFPVRKW